MKVYSDISMSDFRPWSGAVYAYDRIQNAGKLDDLESIIEELYPEGCSETTINDLLWFEDEYLFNLLGIRTESEIREEIEEAHGELDTLWEDFLSEAEDMAEDEKSAYYAKYYANDIEELQEKIAELEEELSEI